MDLRITTGLNPTVASTPRQAQSARLARWRDGAVAAQQQPVRPPGAETAPPVASQPQKPDPFPYLLNPFGGFQESDAGQALQRIRKAEREPDGAVAPYRSPRQIPEDAAAKAISKSLAAAAERQERLQEEQAATDRAAEAIKREAAAEAHRVLLEQQRTQLKNRVEQLGTLLEILVGRYSAVPAQSEPTRLDTRQ